MNIIDFLKPNLPTEWSIKHKTGTDPHNAGDDLGVAKSHHIISTQPAIEWSFQENGENSKLRLTILDQHGKVKVEVKGTNETNPGAKSGFGNHDGVTAIIKCTYTVGELKHEYRFEGKLIGVPFE